MIEILIFLLILFDLSLFAVLFSYLSIVYLEANR